MITVTSRVHEEVVNRTLARIKTMRAKLKTPVVMTVGIHEQEGAAYKKDYRGKPTAVPLVNAMRNHEYGITTPKRSWLRTWFDRTRAEYKTVLEGVAVDWLHSGRNTASTLLLQSGQKWASELAEGIVTESAGLARLSWRTKEKKENAGLAQPATPLVATFQFVRAIKAKLR